MASSFLTCVLYCALLVLSARANAQGANSIEERVTFTNAVVGMAAACGAPAADVEKATDLVSVRLAEGRPNLAQRLNRAWFGQEVTELTASFASAGGERGSFFGKPCSYWRMQLDVLVRTSASEIDFSEAAAPPAPSPAKPDQAGLTREELRRQLQANIGRLPRGKLRQLTGCWSAETEGWTMRLCFTNGGDGSTLELRNGTGASCRLTDGAARRRSDGAFFYAFAPRGTCSTGQPIQHVEGYCDNLSGEFKCLVSIYQTGNTFFQLQDGTKEKPASGTFVFRRTTPQ